jgi:hygromycin-B 7''-O-kinase
LNHQAIGRTFRALLSDEPIQYSARLGGLSRRQLQAALDRFELGKLLDVEVPVGGLFGQNLFLRAESGDWVFRGAPHWYRLEPHPTWQFAKERWFAERIQRDTSVPVPWPYLVETSPEIFGWAFALMPRMPGEQCKIAKASLPLEDRIAIARAMAETLAELHSLHAPAAGEYDPELDAIAALPSLRDHARRTLAGVRERAIRLFSFGSVVEKEDLALVDAVAREADAALDVPAEPSCLHLDYHHGNLNVARSGRDWRVTGVFDLMTCEFGDAEQDLSRPLGTFSFEDPALVEPFLASYTALRPLRPGARERFRLFMLIDTLILWSFLSRNQPELFEPTDRYRTWAASHLDLADRL